MSQPTNETPFVDSKSFDADNGTEVIRSEDARTIERAANGLRDAARNYRARVMLSAVAQTDYLMTQCHENAKALTEASCAESDAGDTLAKALAALDSLKGAKG